MTKEGRNDLSIFAVGMVLGLASVPLWAAAHGDHEHEAVEVRKSPAPSAAPIQELDANTTASSLVSARLQSCRWRTEYRDSYIGNIYARCEQGEVPVGNGVHRTFSYVDPDFFSNLGFAEGSIQGTSIGDGWVDGYQLADGHASIHGEPPEHGRTAAAFAAMSNERGTGTHIMHSGLPGEFQTVATLCCEVSP